MEKGPELPRGIKYLWEWFNEVFDGGNLTFAEIQAWSQLTRRDVRAWEVDVLKNLEQTYLKVQNDQRSSGAQGKRR